MIENFETGLELSKASSSQIQDNTFSYNKWGVEMFNGEANQFSGNSFYGNEEGIHFTTDNNIFWNNDFYDNTLHIKPLYYPQGNK